MLNRKAIDEIGDLIERIGIEYHKNNRPTESMFVAMLVGAYRIGLKDGRQENEVAVSEILKGSL